MVAFIKIYSAKNSKDLKAFSTPYQYLKVRSWQQRQWSCTIDFITFLKEGSRMNELSFMFFWRLVICSKNLRRRATGGGAGFRFEGTDEATRMQTAVSFEVIMKQLKMHF